MPDETQAVPKESQYQRARRLFDQANYPDKAHVPPTRDVPEAFVNIRENLKRAIKDLVEREQCQEQRRLELAMHERELEAYRKDVAGYIDQCLELLQELDPRIPKEVNHAGGAILRR